MQSRAAFFGTVALAGTVLLFSPRLALNPGPLAPGHAELANRCLSCHTPLRGAPAEKCIGCHPLDSIGIGARASAPAPTRPALAGMHARFRGVDCIDCHTDHLGDDATDRPFSHEALGPSVREACASCHAAERPGDALHRQVGADCTACHETRGWTPASFAHDRYFVLDHNHDAPCRTCHAPGAGYASYTCYGCHAHTPARIMAEHREEGIRDLAGCARCHRSAAEHEGGGEASGERD